MSSAPNTSARSLLFLSHAMPEDAGFAEWLGIQLANQGYEVWSEATKLIGGERFWSRIGEVMDTEVVKTIAVISRNSAKKNGVLNEISRAVEVAEGHGIPVEEFIQPIILDDVPRHHVPIEVGRQNAIHFDESWATGLARLLKVLDRDKVPKAVTPSAVGAWVRNHYEGAHGVVAREETLVSNAHPLLRLPERLRIYEFDVSESKLDALEQAFAWPFVRYDRFILTFAPLDELQADLPSSVTARMKAQVKIENFLKGKAGFGILPRDAQNMATRLLRQAWERHCQRHQLASARLASGNLCWYQPGATRDQVRFIDADGKPRRKALGGTKGRKAEDGSREITLHWHYAVFARIVLGERPQATMEPHVVFTTDGTTLLEDDKKAHRARRKICKSWYNEQWRTLHLAYMALICGGEETITVAVSSDQFLELGARPEIFTCSAGYDAPAVKSRAPKDEAAPSPEAVPDEDAERDEELGEDGEDPWDTDEAEG